MARSEIIQRNMKRTKVERVRRRDQRLRTMKMETSIALLNAQLKWAQEYDSHQSVEAEIPFASFVVVIAIGLAAIILAGTLASGAALPSPPSSATPSHAKNIVARRTDRHDVRTNLYAPHAMAVAGSGGQ